MRIKELAERTGHTTETIRYYEKIGLIEPALREANNYRSYGPKHLAALDFIRRCRHLDLGLEEIRLLLTALKSGSPAEADRAHELVHRQLEEVDARINDLMELRGHLEMLAARCGGHHRPGEPCGILAELESGNVCNHSEGHAREQLRRRGED